MLDDQRRREAESRRIEGMRLAQAGDRDAYRALLDDVGPQVWRYLRRHVEREDLDDAYQEVFLSLHRYRHTYKPPRPVTPWLITIARHVAIEVSRRRRLRGQREIDGESVPEPAIELERDLRTQLLQGLRRLTPYQRQAFELVQLKGLTMAEAAAHVGTTVGAFKVRAHRASQALRAVLLA